MYRVSCLSYRNLPCMLTANMETDFLLRGAGKPDMARKLYEYILQCCQEQILVVEHGEFGADMKVSLLNDGPFTVILDSDELFYLAFWCLLSSSLTATSWDPKFWAIPRAYQASGLFFHHDIQRLFRPSGHDSRRSYLCGDLRRCKGAYQ